MLSIELGSIVFVTILFLVTNPYPNAAPIIVTASTGPVNEGSKSTFVITEYDSKAAIVRATALNAYDMYAKALVLSIFDYADRTNILSNESTNIIPIAKKTASIRAIWTPSVADATTDNVNADI